MIQKFGRKDDKMVKILKKWFKKKKKNKYIDSFGEAFLRLAHILSDEIDNSMAYAISMSITDDYNDWPENKKIMFTKDIRENEKDRKKK